MVQQSFNTASFIVFDLDDMSIRRSATLPSWLLHAVGFEGTSHRAPGRASTFPGTEAVTVDEHTFNGPLSSTTPLRRHVRWEEHPPIGTRAEPSNDPGDWGSDFEPSGRRQSPFDLLDPLSDEERRQLDRTQFSFKTAPDSTKEGSETEHQRERPGDDDSVAGETISLDSDSVTLEEAAEGGAGESDSKVTVWGTPMVKLPTAEDQKPAVSPAALLSRKHDAHKKKRGVSIRVVVPDINLKNISLGNGFSPRRAPLVDFVTSPRRGSAAGPTVGTKEDLEEEGG